MNAMSWASVAIFSVQKSSDVVSESLAPFIHTHQTSTNHFFLKLYRLIFLYNWKKDILVLKIQVILKAHSAQQAIVTLTTDLTVLHLVFYFLTHCLVCLHVQDRPICVELSHLFKYPVYWRTCIYTYRKSKRFPRQPFHYAKWLSQVSSSLPLYYGPHPTWINQITA